MRIVIELDPSDKGFQEIVTKAIRESLRSEHGVASQTDLKHVEQHILERLKTMPTMPELQAAVTAAVAAEREQHVAAITKAVEDAIANAANISDADAKIILDAISDTVPPGPTPAVPPVV